MANSILITHINFWEPWQAFPEKYILVGKNPVPCPSYETFAEWWDTPANRVIAKTTFLGGSLRLSTVFLGYRYPGIDADGNLIDLLFETKIFEDSEHSLLHGEFEDIEFRFQTYEEAEGFHWAMVKGLRDRFAVSSSRRFNLKRKSRAARIGQPLNQS